MSDLRLLPEWESRWESFKDALGPALRRSEAHSDIEKLYTGIPKRSLATSYLMHAAVIFTYLSLAPLFWVVWNAHFPAVQLKPYQHEVLYYSPLLPAVSDVRGAEEGKSGKSGGREIFHPYQTIRISRGKKLVEIVVDAPRLKLPHTNDPVANLLALSGDHSPQSAPPPPERRNLHRAVDIAAAAVAPTPQAQRDKLRSAAELRAEVVAPAASVPQRVVPNATRMAYQAEVVAPIAVASRESQGTPKLTLPVMEVVAPPVSANNFDNSRLSGPLVAGAQHFDVVPPPVQVDARARGMNGRGGVQQHYEVVGAPAQATGLGRKSTAIASATPGVAGPAEGSADGQPGGKAGGTGNTPGGTGKSGSSAIASQNGKGNGPGVGSGEDGLIISAHPGSTIGIPNKGGLGTLAMSPNGGFQPGLGGSGGGIGIGRGTGPGSGKEGLGSGGGSKGGGPGADPMAHGGIAPGIGPGGAGNGSNAPSFAGVSISGNVANIPSFNAPNSSLSGTPGIGPRELQGRGPAIVVVATSRAGGALAQYGTLPGSRVYTIYVDLPATTAVVQYADPGSSSAMEDELTAPQPIQTNFPTELKESQAVVSCTLDRLGKLREFKFLKAPPAALHDKMLAVLKSWRFRPVLRGEEAIDVNAIVGIGVDTR